MLFEPMESLFVSMPVEQPWHIPPMASPGRRALSGQYRGSGLELTRQPQESGRARDPVGDLQSWLQALYARCARNEIDPAIDQVLEVVEELLYERQFTRVMSSWSAPTWSICPSK